MSTLRSLSCYRADEKHSVQQTIIHVPSLTDDIQLLAEYLRLIYSIDVQINGTSRILIVRGETDEICNAQNFALRYLGPEFCTKIGMPVNILQLCTLKTIRKYFAVRNHVIVTVKGKNCLIMRGPLIWTKHLSKSLQQLYSLSKSVFFGIVDTKKKAFKKLCFEVNIDYSQLKDFSVPLKLGMFDLIVEMESFSQSMSNGSLNKSPLNVMVYDEPNFIEVYRRPTINEIDHAPNVKRLRPVIIDGANIIHGDGVQSTSLEIKNLRCVLQYFIDRKHTEIVIVMHGIRQALCSKEFTMDELNQYFCFTSCRRHKNAQTQIADDDSVILEFALKKDAVVISNDHYRNWLSVRPEFRDVITSRIIPFSIHKGTFVISEFPMGKNKPNLSSILCF